MGGLAGRLAADKRAQALAPILRELRDAGMVTLQAMADELNKRQIATAYGGRWYATTVLNLLRRLGWTREPMA